MDASPARSPRLCALVVAIVMIALAGPASAELMLRLTDVEGGDVVLCEDQSACDLNPTIGVVTIVGSVGQFDIDFTTAFSKPVTGGPEVAEMDVRSLNVIRRGDVGDPGGTLIIESSDTDFDIGSSAATLVSTISGTMRSVAGSSVRAQQCLSLGNETQFDTRDGATELKSCDAFLAHGPLVQSGNQPLPFADQKSTGVSLTGANFSIAERIILGFSGNGNAIFDFDSAVNKPRPRRIPRR